MLKTKSAHRQLSTAILLLLLTIVNAISIYAQDETGPILELITPANLTRLQSLAEWEPDNKLLSPTISILPSKNSDLVLVTNRRKGLLGVIDTRKLELENVLQFSSTPLIRKTAISPDGQIIITGDIKTLDIRDAITGKIKFTVSVPNDQFEINGIDISSETQLLAITAINTDPSQASKDRIYIYSLTDNKERLMFSDIKAPFPLFSADGKYLILGGYNGILRLGNTETGETIDIRSEDNLVNYPVDVLSSETIVLALYDSIHNKNILESWNIGNKKQVEIREPRIFSEYIKDGISQIPQNNYGDLQLWNILTQKKLALINEESVQDINVEQNLLITQFMGQINFRELDTGKLLYTLSKPNLYSATFTSDYRHLILWGEDGYLEIWGIVLQESAKNAFKAPV